MKTPSSCLSRGLPGWPLNPPLMFIPSFSPSNRWIVISCNPLGGGSCWTVKISSAVGSNRACTASWWLALETSLPLTLRIRSPIRSRIVLAATPSGMTWKKNTRNPSKNPGRHNIYKKEKTRHGTDRHVLLIWRLPDRRHQKVHTNDRSHRQYWDPADRHLFAKSHPGVRACEREKKKELVNDSP